mgnify:CR=1 FL=1
MPLVHRAEKDIFRLETVSDYMVCPTNTVGSMSKGLGLAFHEHVDGLYTYYKNKLKKDDFHIGQVYAYKPKNTSITTLLLPTKRHWVDGPDLDLTKRALRALRRFLQDVPSRVVTMPSLSASIQDADVSKDITDLMYTYLDDLPNIIHVSTWPSDFKTPPLYLAVIGSQTITDVSYITSCIQDACTTWQVDPKQDFWKWISGATSGGVDVVACGKMYDDKKALVHILGPKNTLIVQSDTERYGTYATIKRDRCLMDIATHVIGIADPKKALRVQQALGLVKRWNAKCDSHDVKLYRHYTKK